MITEESTICERIRRLGFAQNNQVTLYGEIFDLLSDPIVAGHDLVFVDAFERKSGRRRRIRIPLNIVHMARKGGVAILQRYRKIA